MPEKSPDLLHPQMPGKSSGPWNATFYIPQCRKILVPWSHGPGLPPGARLLWHTWRHVKCLNLGTGRLLWRLGMQKVSLQGAEEFSDIGECEKDLWVAGKMSWYQQRDCQSLAMEFSGGKLKQKGFFHSVIILNFILNVATASAPEIYAGQKSCNQYTYQKLKKNCHEWLTRSHGISGGGEGEAYQYS